MLCLGSKIWILTLFWKGYHTSFSESRNRFRYLCVFTISFYNLSEISEEYRVSGVDQFPAELFDTHERAAFCPRRVRWPSWPDTVKHRDPFQPPVCKHRSQDDFHRQDVLRPEGHQAGGRLGGLQRVPGTSGAHRERGLALRHHHPGLQRAQPTSEQVPPSAGGPGFPL